MEENFVSKVQVGPGANSLEFLQAIYRSPHVSLAVRMRAAGMALQFEHPKLGVTVNISGGDLAERLDKAIERSRSMKVIEHRANAEGLPNRNHPAEELKGIRLRRL
jgi:hypothetical protein